MISVCIATYNGEKYIYEQLKSILTQLSVDDEIIVSDDGSTDSTITQIMQFNDPRIKILINKGKRGIVSNFENALRNSKGDYLFLSDQDDYWLPEKVAKCMSFLQTNSLIVHNAIIVSQDLEKTNSDLFAVQKSRSGFWKNFIKNSYTGCCMAFDRSIVDKALPFPIKIAIHDMWIGLVAEIYNKNIAFTDEPLILYRRHGANLSSTSEKSNFSIKNRLHFRIYMLIKLVARRINS